MIQFNMTGQEKVTFKYRGLLNRGMTIQNETFSNWFGWNIGIYRDSQEFFQLYHDYQT